mgnify:CR=1 FL=1
MKIKELVALAGFILISELAGIMGSVFTFSSVRVWYPTLIKPWFTPPSWVFGPVWTTLYALMGISLFLIWKQGIDRKEDYIAVGLFATQLFLNGLWTFLFFGLQNLLLGLIEILILLLFILLTTIKFYTIDKRAAYLLVPYIAWVCIATALNYSLYLLN